MKLFVCIEDNDVIFASSDFNEVEKYLEKLDFKPSINLLTIINDKLVSVEDYTFYDWPVVTVPAHYINN